MIIKFLFFLVLIHILYTWLSAVQRGWLARKRMQNVLDIPIADLPPVSILIPAWREVGTIEDCIRSLQKVSYPEWEAIVLAGGPDGTLEKAAELTESDHRFRVIERGPEPKNVALVKGVEAALFDILVLLDADSIVSQEWLIELVKPLLLGAAASVGHRIPKKVTWISLAEHLEDIHAFAIQDTPPIYGDSSLAIWREYLERAETLPPDAYAREDWAIEVALLDKGGSIHFAQGARLFTNRPSTFREAWQNSIRTHQSHLGGIKDHWNKYKSEPLWAFGMAYYFVLFFGILCALVCSLIIGYLLPALGINLADVSLLISFWFVFRYASMALEVTIYTEDLIWLVRFHYLVGLYAIRIATAGPAFLAGNLKNPFYKGPRVSTIIDIGRKLS